jgi:hypothetical protein
MQVAPVQKPGPASPVKVLIRDQGGVRGGINAQIQCPCCEALLWLSARVQGYRIRDVTHSFEVLDLIPLLPTTAETSPAAGPGRR